MHKERRASLSDCLAPDCVSVSYTHLDVYKRQEVSKAKVALRRLPWGTGAFIALLCFGVGEYSKGTSGAIAGGMLGLFMGLGYVWNAKGSAESTLEQAEFDLKSVQRDRRIRKLHPETFSRSEEVLGEEQEEFGDESARANVVRFLEENPA